MGSRVLECVWNVHFISILAVLFSWIKSCLDIPTPTTKTIKSLQKILASTFSVERSSVLNVANQEQEEGGRESVGSGVWQQRRRETEKGLVEGLLSNAFINLHPFFRSPSLRLSHLRSHPRNPTAARNRRRKKKTWYRWRSRNRRFVFGNTYESNISFRSALFLTAAVQTALMCR
jgi:hypothetical protein